MNTRTFRLVLLALTLILPILLWITRTEYFETMSQYADADNEILYNAMHICGALFFVFTYQWSKRTLDVFIGMAMIGVLLTNTYDFPIWHLIATGSLVALCMGSMIFYSRATDRPNNILLAVFCAGIFILALLTDIHVFLAEWLVMMSVSIHMLRRMFIHPNA